jgi:hypothetical protein
MRLALTTANQSICLVAAKTPLLRRRRVLLPLPPPLRTTSARLLFLNHPHALFGHGGGKLACHPSTALYYVL